MKKLTAFLLMLIVAAGLICGAAAAETTGEETPERLADEVLMSFFDNTMFAGDSMVSMFYNYTKTKRNESPWYFSNVDFRTANSYKLRFASYKTIPSGELKYAHLVVTGKKVTLYSIVKEKKPEKLFILAGINDALTTDYTKARQGKDETGIERALRYIRDTAEIMLEASPGTTVYIVSQMPVTKSYVQGTNKAKKCQERWDEINEALLAASEEIGIRFVDLAAGLKDGDGFLPASLSSDGQYHLNKDGDDILARELLDFAQAEYEAGRWIPAEKNGTEE